jgi:metallophosphoesterase (TIGR00282 family)
MIKILFLGDVVGEPGRKAVIARLPELKREENLDFVVVNGENAAGGRGITPKISIDLLRAGAAVITTGDHVWDQREIVEYFPTEPRLLRPINYSAGAPGAGSVVLETAKGRVGVINAQGRVFMNPPLDNPLPAVETAAAALRDAGVNVVLVDFHAEATSEKLSMGRALDGKVSLVVGTHTHVQTADEQIFPGGTAYLTDAGMCGPDVSVLGREVSSVVWRFRTGLPTRFPVAKGLVRLCGLIVEVDEATGAARTIRRVSELFDSSKDRAVKPDGGEEEGEGG